MSTFDDPFDTPHRDASPGCACGRHRSQAEHDHAARHMLRCAPVEPAGSAEVSVQTRYRGVVAAAALRAFAKGA